MAIEPAEWMEPAARKLWRDLAPCLPDGTVEQGGNRYAFAMMCQAYVEFVRMCLLIQGNEAVTRQSPTGAYETENARCKIRDRAYGRFMELAAHFGCTPLAHEKLRRAALDPDTAMQPDPLLD